MFLSSPSDVLAEREAATRVVNRINADLGGDLGFELHRWEDDYYTADSTFQGQITKSSDCDIVICIFWKRLGSPLPPQFIREDGTVPTGTEYEFEIAMRKAMASVPKAPDIIAYRKRDEIYLSESNLAVEFEQLNLFKEFWRRWFKNEQGIFVAAYHNFNDTADFEEQFEQHLRSWLDDREIPLVWTGGSPFCGLSPFELEHASIFFGRNREVDRARARILANALKGHPFLLISGPSGSGKSSLVRAGLLPRLMHSGGVEELPQLDLYMTVSPSMLMEAGKGDWALGLAEAFFGMDNFSQALRAGDFDTPERLAALIMRSGPDVAAPVSRAAERIGPAQGFILVLDQLEEVFAWPVTAAMDFAAVLEALKTSAPVIIVATLRSEFQHRIGEIPALERLCGLRALAGPSEPVPVMEIGLPRAADLREMILKPAAAAGVFYEGPKGDLPGLSERIESDSGPGTLPAMQLLLSQLFDKRQGKLMTHAAYEAVEGVQGVMAARADAVLEEQPPATRDCMPRLARALIQSDASGRVVTSRRMPLDLFPEHSPERQLAAALQDAGLLISEGTSLRIAHESLIEGWSVLKNVVLQEAHNLAILNRVASQYRGFQEAIASGKADARRAHLTGLALQEARALKTSWGEEALDAREPGLSEYVDKSATSYRRRRLAITVFAGAFAASVIAVGFIANQFYASQARASLRQHLGNAEARLRNGEWHRALESAVAALGMSNDAETRSVALTALIETGSGHRRGTWDGNFVAVAAGQQNDVLALNRDGSMIEVNRTGDVFKKRFPAGVTSTTGAQYARMWALSDGSLLALRNDGSAVFLSASDATATEIEMTSGKLYISHSEQADLHEFDSGFMLAVGHVGLSPGRLVTCSSASGHPDCKVRDLPGGIRALAFAADGKRLAIATRAAVYELNVAAGGKNKELPRPMGRVLSLAWLDQYVVAGLSKGELVLFDPEGADREESAWLVFPPAQAYRNAAKGIMRIETDAKGQRLAYDCAVERICIASIEGRKLRLDDIVFRTGSDLRDLVWSGDGSRLVSVHSDGSIAAWQVDPGDRISALILPARVRVSALAADSERDRLWVGDEEGTITRLDGDGQRMFELQDGEIKHMVVAPNGALAAATASGQLMRIDGEETIETVDVEGGLVRVAWLDDGETLVATRSDSIVRWRVGEVPQTKIVRPVSEPKAPGSYHTLGGIAVTPDGNDLIVSVSNGGLYRVDADDTALVVPLQASADELSSLGFHVSSDGKYLATTRSDDLIRIFDLVAMDMVLELKIPTRDTRVAKFSPDGTRLAVLASSGKIHVWKLSANLSSAEKLFDVDPTPWFGDRGATFDTADAAVWLDWIDETHLSSAYRSYGTVVIDTRVNLLQDEVEKAINANLPIENSRVE
ncbi:MAG: WD40 repeat domain-containing protein [Hyphomicrobiales bacterium]|nr:WD40 repeat domain-containing protein [Hyphomicrobiales bacterium]